MPLKDLLVHLDQTDQCEARLDLALALALARRHGARLTGIFALINPDVPSAAPHSMIPFLREAAAVAQAAFRAEVGQAGLAADWYPVHYSGDSRIVNQVILAARHADLAILGQPDRSLGHGGPWNLVEQVVLEAGRPVLTVPFVGHYDTVGEEVVVAWNGSRGAARALGDALPLMHQARRVTVLAIHPDRASGERAADSLARVIRNLVCHGIAAKAEVLTSTEAGITDAILSLAADVGADLLVMGAHGLSGFPTLHRGGTTRSILQQMTMPVLLSH